MSKQTINKVRQVEYVAKGFTTGLTDLVVAVRKPDASFLTPAPTATERGDGAYIFSYTPDMVGYWEEIYTSVTNGDKLIKAYEVVAYDVDDIHSQVDGVETKVDTLQTTANTIDGKVDGIQTDVTTANNKLDVIDGKIDALDNQTNSGGYIA